jgi:N4-(beta-N-acetylglucosaminyl)-L-asparaginase
MEWGIIATWRMALDGVVEGSKLLRREELSGNAIEKAIQCVENNPYYTSVGYGGLPNEQGEVELDAAYMDGDNLSIGAVAGIKDFENPISIAKDLSKNRFNILLVGKGAEEYAASNGFKRKDMLTEESKRKWEERKKEVYKNNLTPYDGHDTVGMVALDTKGSMVSATSTSGLFMKKRGRVGDSPIPGSGFYVSSEIGGSTATGLGEDLMKGCISYEVVRLMKEGYTPQQAAEMALYELHNNLEKKRGKAGAMSIVCMNNKGEWGVATNVRFSFVVATSKIEPTVFIAYMEDGKTVYKEAEKEWVNLNIND